MRTKESLKLEIRELTMAYAKAGVELSREHRAGRTIHLERLLCARNQILLSIAHRQGMLVKVLETEIEYSTERKAA
jgi:hypothetical protein